MLCISDSFSQASQECYHSQGSVDDPRESVLATHVTCGSRERPEKTTGHVAMSRLWESVSLDYASCGKNIIAHEEHPLLPSPREEKDKKQAGN